MPYAKRDGLRLYYERAGSGEPTFVFVPGWCCDHTLFEPQVEHFGGPSTVVTYDLRGCGTSDCPDDGYDIPTVADDVEWLCSELTIEKPVVVGHSLGAQIGIELGARAVLPAAVVAVDPGPIDMLPESRAALEALAQNLESDGADPRAEYVASMFLPTDDTERARRIADTMCSVPAPIAARMLRGYLAWDGVESLRRCAVPLLVVLRAPGGSNDPSRLLPIKPDVVVGVTVGAGHFNQLDAADQVNAMITDFVRVAA